MLAIARSLDVGSQIFAAARTVYPDVYSVIPVAGSVYQRLNGGITLHAIRLSNTLSGGE